MIYFWILSRVTGIVPGRVFTNAAEDLAVRFLRSSGFTVLSRNDRRFGAEIDIICREPERHELAVFEVKERMPHSYFPAISVRQRARIIRAISAIESEADRLLPVTLYALLVNTRRESLCVIPLTDFSGG